MPAKKLAPIIAIFALGSGIITGSILGNQLLRQRAKNEVAREIIKDKGYEILKHETNYDDLHKRYDHIKANYENLGKNYLNYREEKERLENENQRLRNQLISRGKKRSLSTRRRAYGRAPAGISRRAVYGGSDLVSRILNCESGNQNIPNSGGSGAFGPAQL